MKTLVIGATGIIGNHVVRALLDKGHEVRAFSRGLTPSKNLEGLKVEIFRGDLNDRSSLVNAMQGCDWIFHTAAHYPTNMFDVEGHKETARRQMESVLKSCKEAKVRRLVYTSSLTTIGHPHRGAGGGPAWPLADETCPYNLKKDPHPYFAVKVLMEDMVVEAAKKGLPAVIVNPTGCFGPYELKDPKLCLIPQLVKGKMPAYVDHVINVVDVADVGRGHVLAALKGRIGERYILGGHNETAGSLIRQVCKVAKVPPPRIKAPLGAALIIAGASEYLARYVFRAVPAFSILGLKFLQYGQPMTSKKAIEELGYTISPMKPCFERAVAWFKEIGYC